MAKYTRLQNDANAERDFDAAMSKMSSETTALRSVAFWHHTATSRVYIGVNDGAVIHYYKGKFGEGFVWYRRNDRYPSLSYKCYFIYREYFKEYKK